MAAPMMFLNLVTSGLFDTRRPEQRLDLPTRENLEDMRHKPTVNVSYDEYHQMQDEINKFHEMVRKHSVCVRKPGSYDFSEYQLITPNKAIKQLEEQYKQLAKDYQDLKRVAEADSQYIQHLENRSLFARILNKKN